MKEANLTLQVHCNRALTRAVEKQEIRITVAAVSNKVHDVAVTDLSKDIEHGPEPFVAFFKALD